MSHNSGLAGHERDWPPFQVVISGRSAGDAPLFHTLPSSDTTMRQLCGGKSVGLCFAGSPQSVTFISMGSSTLLLLLVLLDTIAAPVDVCR